MGTQGVEFLKRGNEVADTPGMTDVEAAWVREHVWTKPMRRDHKSCPAFYSTCACQGSRSGYCSAGAHHRCEPHLQVPGPETWICNRRSMVMGFRTRFEHPTLTITGRRRLSEAAVWLADRACVWRCPCDCHQFGGVDVGQQLNLFGVAV